MTPPVARPDVSVLLEILDLVRYRDLFDSEKTILVDAMPALLTYLLAVEGERVHDHRSENELIQAIAKRLGYAQAWEAPNQPGVWIVERPGKPGFIEAARLLDVLDAALTPAPTKGALT